MQRQNALVSRSVCVLLTILILLPLSNLAASDGDLDLSFGGSGKITTDFSGNFDIAFDVVVQPDRRIVVGGTNLLDFALVRYDSNGSLDSSFGLGGRVTTDFGLSDQAHVIGLQPDGSIVAAGTSLAFLPGPFFDFNFALARYKPSGELDPSFGVSGKVVMGSSTTDDDLRGLAFQPDGKIVVVGSSVDRSTNATDFVVFRLNNNGTLDPTFGVGGMVTTDFLGGLDHAFAVAVQPDGRIVVAGLTLNLPSLHLSFALARYTTDGLLDSTFGSGGKVIIQPGFPGAAVALALQADGKIIAAGNSLANSFDFATRDHALARFNVDGSLDPTFGTGGIVITDFFGQDDEVRDLAIQGDGKIVAVGNASTSSLSSDFGIVRYNPDGSLDSTFGMGGKVSTNILGNRDIALGAAIQQDGQIVVAGQASHELLSDFAVVRYAAEPTPTPRPQPVCIQDSVKRDFLTFDPETGEYQFTQCAIKGVTLRGTGTTNRVACQISLKDSRSTHAVSVSFDICRGTGSATIKLLPSGPTFTLIESDTKGKTCACP